MKKVILLVLSLCWYSISASAQDINQIIESFNDTAIIPREEAPLAAAPIMAKKWNQFKTKYFTLNFGMAFILDHNITSQDENNIQQVGEVGPGTEFRGERFIVSGNLLFFKHPWRYMISANFNGLDNPPGDKSFSFIDWNFEIPFGKKGGWLTIGKQKEGVGHEYVAPGTQLMFMERGSGVPMFVRQRNIGIRYSNSIMDHRATYTVGFFNNYWETGKSFSDNGSQITLRATGLPQYKSDADLLHVGVGYRYSGSSDGSLSYKAKPEVNTAPNYISTGTFDANASNTLMLELIKVHGAFSFIGEYMNSFVSSSTIGTPSFDYWTVGGSWFITGENRKYNKNNGNLGKLIPKKNFRFKKGSGPGAFELGARYTKSDLADGAIQGGKFGRFTGALSWYPNPSLRFSVNYGNGSLDRNDLKGKANFWQFRMQFEL
jgi:phosphate-selective porin OprO/OprP